jgi:hypothetical protein
VPSMRPGGHSGLAAHELRSQATVESDGRASLEIDDMISLMRALISGSDLTDFDQALQEPLLARVT